MLFKKYTLTKV